jgi:hypothetical protein
MLMERGHDGPNTMPQVGTIWVNIGDSSVHHAGRHWAPIGLVWPTIRTTHTQKRFGATGSFVYQLQYHEAHVPHTYNAYINFVSVILSYQWGQFIRSNSSIV